MLFFINHFDFNHIHTSFTLLYSINLQKKTHLRYTSLWSSCQRQIPPRIDKRKTSKNSLRKQWHNQQQIQPNYTMPKMGYVHTGQQSIQKAILRKWRQGKRQTAKDLANNCHHKPNRVLWQLFHTEYPWNCIPIRYDIWSLATFDLAYRCLSRAFR